MGLVVLVTCANPLSGDGVPLLDIFAKSVVVVVVFCFLWGFLENKFLIIKQIIYPDLLTNISDILTSYCPTFFFYFDVFNKIYLLHVYMYVT